ETDIMLTLDLESLYPRMAGMLGNSRLRHLVVGQLTEFCGPVSAAAAGQLGPSVPVAMDAQTLSFASLLDNDGDYRAHPQGDPAAGLAVLQYPRGPTGVPKGARRARANSPAPCAQRDALLRDALARGRERVLAGRPPFRISALMV